MKFYGGHLEVESKWVLEVLGTSSRSLRTRGGGRFKDPDGINSCESWVDGCYSCSLVES